MLIGDTLDVPTATDRDSGQNKALQYEMWPALPQFDLLWNSSAGKLSLRLKQELDREREDTYKCSIIARDTGLQPQSSTLNLNIVVQDVNDNSPVFEKSTYTVSIPEDTKPSTKILQVRFRFDEMDWFHAITMAFTTCFRSQVGLSE